MLSAQCSVTSLQRGLYSCVMTGPQGVVLDFGMEIEARTPERVALDDEFLKEMLVINSVCGCAAGKARRAAEADERALSERLKEAAAHGGGSANAPAPRRGSNGPA